MIFTAIGVLLMTLATSLISLIGLVSIPLDFIIDPLVTAMNFAYHGFTIIAILVHPSFLISCTVLGTFLFFFDIGWWSTKLTSAMSDLIVLLRKIF